MSWTHPESVWRSHIYLMLGNSITDVVHSLYKVFYLKQSPKFLEISNALCYIEYKERHLLEQMPFSSDSIHSKSGCSQVCIFSYEHSLTCLPTGKAFLFLLIISLIEKGKKRNNQTTKRHQQS